MKSDITCKMSDVEESAGDESVSESGDESNDDVESDASAIN